MMATRRKAKPVDLFQQYQNALHQWAGDAPADMLDEDNKEKLLDAMLRLFETLDAADLRNAISNLRAEKTLRELLGPLTAAMRWQMIGLNIQSPQILAPIAPHVLSLAVIRWIPIWQNEHTPGMPKLMAAIDRDLGYLQRAIESLQKFKLTAE
ncbi:MAG TPA: hypothetical protein PKW15_03155 [Alphaproteobacteria bacterium]|nr:hypothetical protein [Rhodospirillaceae bacterium]HRJ12223.1 hypothetical protein [Alphaproteobacteria bacterium]